MMNWPSGSYLVLKCTTPKNSVDLFAIGYKYSKSEVLIFIATKGAGSTSEGAPYYAKYTDLHGNRQERKIFRPSVISDYFEYSNAIDVHNHARQGVLRLEDCWRTQDCWFRLATTFIGMTLTDAWKAYKYHTDENIPVRIFADKVSKQLIRNTYPREEREQFIPIDTSARPMLVSPLSTDSIHHDESTSPISLCSEIGSSHEFVRTMQKEGHAARTKRRVCSAALCQVKTDLECSNPVCRAFIHQQNRFKSKGIFYCEKHIHLHHLNFMPRANENFN